ncbi:MAG: undecaprenyl-diphosphate phosphatase [Paludibacteraceae bacterium]|nr:undecaprenyl-diphosphate phosphatase [Paludibacteraceae bacterium]MED9996617.1 undecaprenyl-diphosphate phosphatase [Paludibacteraceae bacterium]
MNWWEALILGLIQGLTEFLPVSSSGHLEIGQALFGTAGEENLLFAVTVHAATVLSTITILWAEIWALLKGCFTKTWNPEKEYVAKIALSMLPILVVGVFFKDQVESFFGSGLLIVGCCLVVTSLLLAFAYFAKPRTREKISYRDAFIIGLSQACAVLPGLSRSGTTIATGLLLGNKKESIAQFSFLMVLVPILGDAFLELLGILQGDVQLGIPVLSLVVGFIAAYISGCLACKWMIQIVKRGKLIYFAAYCLIAGALAIFLA